jgi:exopolyphosphatase/guanosine-5'-triphosphate,3'-diphosphate pyrophosphatase
MKMSDIAAVIDVGTNTTRLLVKDKNNRNVDILRKVTVTRLGDGLDSGMLNDESMERTTNVISQYIDDAINAGANHDSIALFATAACRRASNGSEYIESLAQQFSITTSIISGEEEGERAFLGAMGAISQPKAPAVVFDIGGGSTEFAISTLGDATTCEKVISIPLGSVVLTQRYFESDPPTATELTNAIAEVTEHLKEVELEIPSLGHAAMWIGVAATVTTAAAVEIGLREFDRDKIHEFVLTRDAAEDVFRTLATETLADRKHNPGLEPERADVIVGGMSIIVAIMRHFELPSISVSCSDLLDGLWLRSATFDIG